MDISILLNAAPPIPLHGLAALLAMVLGGVQLALPKGGKPHKICGYIWVGLMVLVSLSSFFIYEFRLIGPFSPIHALSLFTLFSLWQAIKAARNHNIRRHRYIMRMLYLLALLVTGGFTLLPGRIMHQVVFGV